ncbi:CaiB/BaiF CoA transferase family protein [Tianweitania sediminis]|uniref:CoA transferase n=1 Tax=Tianweitania sediminis TaxID=1502156 RepID=A0A8J7R2Z4_9HYPH|nr:CoA transferase [Tianweitania sediminis]MBP0440702.1 CoA transferase [Tianweitania sediminis]
MNEPLTTPSPTGPLKGVKVVELSMFMAGPTCGIMLADLGADVIKVERVPEGDDTRRFRPPEINGEAAAFLMMNRNKRGIAVDAKSPEGLKVLQDLCLSADIVIENFRPGTLDRLGLGYAELAVRKPSLVYGTISGYGLTGPESKRAGLDLIAQAFSGLMSVTGEGPGRPPVKVGAPVSDTTAGMLLALGVTAAYAHVLKTGEGQHVDTSLIEAAITHSYWQSAITLATGETPHPLGSAHPLSSPYQAFECADGWLVVGAPNNLNFGRIVSVLGMPGLASDPRFESNAMRLANRALLAETMAPAFLKRQRAEILAELDAQGVPSGPVNTVPEMLDHPQTRARDMVVAAPHPAGGEVETIGCPIKFSKTPSGVFRGAPLFGQHNEDVAREIGYSADEVAGMTERRVFQQQEKNHG